MVVEPFYVQGGSAEKSRLDLGWEGSVVDVYEVLEVEGVWGRSRLTLQRPVSLALLGPPSVKGAVLPKDVGAELSSGEVGD